MILDNLKIVACCSPPACCPELEILDDLNVSIKDDFGKEIKITQSQMEILSVKFLDEYQLRNNANINSQTLTLEVYEDIDGKEMVAISDSVNGVVIDTVEAFEKLIDLYLQNKKDKEQ